MRLAVVAMALCILTVGVSRAEVPISYRGRPPTVHTPGHCWCKYHGPRGGCKRWICHPKHHKSTEPDG